MVQSPGQPGAARVGHNRQVAWQTRRIGAGYDVLAPDGSEIRLVGEVGGASMVHCTLPPGQTSLAVRHRSVEELWLCVEGAGELWRSDEGGAEEVVALEPGVGVSIPLGVRFQFRATGAEPLRVVIATTPPWPGADEAVPVPGHWTPTRGSHAS
jgi:mannose-6-phosphate isomerase-like protein (cupin superfamily)